MNKPELMSPAGDFTSLKAAIQAGADAVYFGIKGLNMRAGANNFLLSDLKKIASLCHKNNVKAYLALNTIIYENELKIINNILKKAREADIDAIICWDFAIIQEAKKLNIPIFISTQMSIANSESIRFFNELGIKRVVLARECSLDDIKAIRKEFPDIEIEVFCHGAMCVSVSGRCFLSQFQYNRSANRGECIQPCRRRYRIQDPEEEKEYILGEDYYR